ncbi:interleukin-1 beta [Pempheris klunzingeri]|uniref:interleukin-1 beta n=1 Tax=Pempheris klunzingeri TaxID=3127111 RepID=UPI00397FA53B
MGDLDLSQGLECPPEINESGFQSCCFDMMDVQQEILRLDDGLDMLVSHNPNTMSCVASLLLSVNKVKKLLNRRQLSDQEFCSTILDVLVEERHVETTGNPPQTNGKPPFQRVNSMKLCTLCDDDDKDIIYDPAKLQLRAFLLKGGQTEHRGNFQMSKYSTGSSDGCQAVMISIVNSSLYFSCSRQSDQPMLSLEECSVGDLTSISHGGSMARFLFYRNTLCSMTTFQSVNCPGWFISTSQTDKQPVEMCEQDACRYMNFKMN